MKANVKLNKPCIIGIDEAGRGPLAGPVSVGAFAVRSRDVLKKFKGVKDSKQLSEKQREEWFRLIKISVKNSEIFYSVSFAQAETIDGKGLSYAVYSALNRCLKKLEKNNFASPDSIILLDGSLYASSRYTNQKTIIDGDAKEKIIALASICAKVTRDRRMKKLAKEYPDYGFDIHKGYGTKGHYKAIRKHGMLPAVHRKSFLRK
jgi:ribonuclease HII